MKTIVLLNCHEIRCPKVLMYVFIEMCEAFKQRNYNVIIAESIDEINNDCIVFMGNGFQHSDPCSLLYSIAPRAIYIGWYWQNMNTHLLKFIHTYENMLNPNIHVKMCQQQKIHCPLYLRASEHPNSIGTYARTHQYDYCYMGWRYCPELVPYSFKGIYHGVLNHDYFLPYAKRKEIYLSSTFALGFQSDENIENKHVSQRIFEGLAYGCIVLSNSIPACEQTNHIVIYVESRQDVETKMKYFMNHPNILRKKQEEGYAFIKKCGTNHYSIHEFLKRMDSNKLN
jgi:hypothetical protein